MENNEQKATPAQISNLFSEINEMKSQRSHLKDAIDMKKQKLIEYIYTNGPVIAYKNDEPYILEVEMKHPIKLNKAQLADESGVTQSDLNIIGVAELVEDGSLTSEQIKNYQYPDSKRVLSARKAKKKEIRAILGSSVK